MTRCGARGAGQILLVVFMSAGAAAMPIQTDTLPPSAWRLGLSAGMGVCYFSAIDLVDFLNAQTTVAAYGERVPQFKSAAEFFGSGALRLSDDWSLKVEYAYLIATFTTPAPFGLANPGQFDLQLYLPSVLVQYLLLNEGTYNVKAGAGGGLHFGGVDASYFLLKDRYSASGPGFLLDLEANTAFGEHLFAYLGANARWEAIGTLTNAAGRSLQTGTGGEAPPGLSMFGIGARLGVTYYF